MAWIAHIAHISSWCSRVWLTEWHTDATLMGSAVGPDRHLNVHHLLPLHLSKDEPIYLARIPHLFIFLFHSASVNLPKASLLYMCDSWAPFLTTQRAANQRPMECASLKIFFTFNICSNNGSFFYHACYFTVQLKYILPFLDVEFEYPNITRVPESLKKRVSKSSLSL